MKFYNLCLTPDQLGDIGAFGSSAIYADKWQPWVNQEKQFYLDQAILFNPIIEDPNNTEQHYEVLDLMAEMSFRNFPLVVFPYTAGNVMTTAYWWNRVNTSVGPHVVPHVEMPKTAARKDWDVFKENVDHYMSKSSKVAFTYKTDHHEFHLGMLKQYPGRIVLIMNKGHHRHIREIVDVAHKDDVCISTAWHDWGSSNILAWLDHTHRMQANRIEDTSFPMMPNTEIIKRNALTLSQLSKHSTGQLPEDQDKAQSLADRFVALDKISLNHTVSFTAYQAGVMVDKMGYELECDVVKDIVMLVPPATNPNGNGVGGGRSVWIGRAGSREIIVKIIKGFYKKPFELNDEWLLEGFDAIGSKHKFDEAYVMQNTEHIFTYRLWRD